MSDIDFAATLDQLIEKALAAGATSADASMDASRGVDVSVRNGQLETIERDESQGVSLRCFVGQRQAHVSGSDTSAEGLEALIDRCVNMAKIAPEDQYAGIAAPEELAKDWPSLKLWGDDPVEPEVLEEDCRRSRGARHSGHQGCAGVRCELGCRQCLVRGVERFSRPQTLLLFGCRPFRHRGKGWRHGTRL